MSLGNTKPFASNPLIYRNDDDDDNDSWWGGQSFFSLLASDTMEMTATNEDSEDGNNAVDVDVAPSYAYFTPQRKQQQQPNQQQQNRSLSHNALSQLKTMPPTTTTEDDSPMIELSLAK